MKTPARPPDETQRLRTLQSLRVLDTPSDQHFDQITRLAQRLLDVPMALVSLVDSHRQWFKSRQGLDATETPRDVSFCGHTILGDEVMVIEDALLDERFHDNPLVAGEPKIRFYAGYPLRAPNGHKLGTLCVIDREPRRLSAEELDTLIDLGRLTEGQLRSMALATTDELTRIPNRRGFRTIAEQVLANAARSRVPLALLHFDLDGFKEINDVEGHEAGDRALATFARCLLKTCRTADVLGRLGGDEFCALLWGADAAGVERLRERLEKSVGEANRANPGHLPLAYSVGVALCGGESNATLDDLLAEADRRMYEDKVRRKG
jgi:diguanylate cyclase (GGDEF)-like protein